MAYCRDHDLRHERQGGHHDPWGDSTVVRTVRDSPGDIVEELSFHSAHHPLDPTGSVTGCKSPTVLPVPDESQRVADGVFLLNEGRLASVLEVIAVMVMHELVPDATEVNPLVRELMGEQWSG